MSGLSPVQISVQYTWPLYTQCWPYFDCFGGQWTCFTLALLSDEVPQNNIPRISLKVSDASMPASSMSSFVTVGSLIFSIVVLYNEIEIITRSLAFSLLHGKFNFSSDVKTNALLVQHMCYNSFC